MRSRSDRYESRRAAVVEDANRIETTYLRAQTLAEPVRSPSLDLLRRYTDTSIRLSESVPGTDGARRAQADGEVLQRELWRLAGQALDDAPTASAPRLYVETLNEMIDQQTVRVAALVSGLLLVTFDLDRPTRGLIEVPDTPLTDLRASMALPPAAMGPTEP